MKLDIYHDTLVAEIKKQAKIAVESNQIARRLKELLPKRLYQIKRDQDRERQQRRATMRLALTHKDYEKFLQEYVQVAAAAREARIQYETHLMLVYARQSLRAFRRR